MFSFANPSSSAMLFPICCLAIRAVSPKINSSLGSSQEAIRFYGLHANYIFFVQTNIPEVVVLVVKSFNFWRRELGKQPGLMSCDFVGGLFI